MVLRRCLRLLHESGALLGREVGVAAHGDGVAAVPGGHVQFRSRRECPVSEEKRFGGGLTSRIAGPAA